MMKSIPAVWNRFWFAPVAASSVGMMRLTLGLILLVNHIHLWFFIDPLFMPDGPIPVASAEAGLPGPRFSYRDYFGAQGQYLIHGIEVLVFLGLTLGWRSRVMVWLALLIQVSIYQRNPWMQNGGDRVMRLGTLYLALVPCGAALSLDALRKRKDEAEEQLQAMVPMLAHRLLQIQLVVIYVHSGWAKARGATWWDGSALYEAVSVGGYQRWPQASELVLSSPLCQSLMMFGTWLTLFWEMGFGLLVLWRPTRIAALFIGLVIHGGIFSGMMVGAFSFIMLWTYQAWLPPDWLQRLQDWWHERTRTT
jgi:hypothetical protein